MAFKRVAGFGQTEAIQPRQQRAQPLPQQQEPQRGESSLGKTGRNVVREGIRNIPLIAAQFNPAVGAGLLGGELAQGLGNLASSAASYIPQGAQDFFNATSGHISPSRVAQERQGLENFLGGASQIGNPEQYQPVNPLDYLPTGANISRGLEPYLPEGYLQPQSQGEQALGDFTTFAGSALNPLFGGAPKTLGQAATRGALGAAGGVAARGAGLEGLPETIVKSLTAAAPDLATIFTAPGQVAQQVEDQYASAKQFGESLSVPGKNIQNTAEKLATRAKRLADTPANKALYRNAKRLENLADKNGNYSAKDLVDFKQSINELYGKGMEKVVHEINAPIIRELKGLAKQQPVFDIFNKLYFGAEEGWQALNTVGTAGKILENYLSPTAKTSAGYFAIKQLFSGDFLGAVTTGAAAAGSNTLGKAAVKFYDFVERSPQGQKLLTNMLSNIAKDAKEPAIRDFNHLNRLYEKDIRRDKKESQKKGNFKRVNPENLPF